ncbi:MAG: sulfite exporter TauE/SafE family protein [Deltaproteobacteria bacterium]|nr:sulfite exporter TauE/SafE family protein [Deltaproteobacteria bacterium]
MHLEPWQWALGVVSAFLIGVAKTGVPGLGILIVPLMLYVIPEPRASPGAVLPLLSFADLFAVTAYRRHAQWDRVLRLLPWVAAGLGLGMVALWAFDRFHVPDALLTRALGAIVLVMIALQLWRKRSGDSEPSHTLGRAAFFGASAGLATYLANAAGPVMNLYLLAMALPKAEFMGTGAWFYFIVNLVKLPQFALQGRITQSTLWVDLWLAPAVIAGALTGRVLFARIPQALFERVILALALVATVALLVPRG